MFRLAILIGIYSYIIFFLGLLGVLYERVIFITTGIFFLFCLNFFKKIFLSLPVKCLSLINKLRLFGKLVFPLNVSLVGLIVIQAIVNFIGVLGPEHAFDALWYHLTLPKIYLQEHSIFFIPGGLLYYSAMPKLTEMLYVTALAFQGEIAAKVVHYLFGLLAVISLFHFARRYFNFTVSLLVCLVFYSNLVVAWESSTAYIDLARTFYELLALLAFVQWWSKDETKWLRISALMIGFAISTKLLAAGSLLVFVCLIFYKVSRQYGLTRAVLLSGQYLVISISVVLPWLLFAFITTGNPVYPIFSTYHVVTAHDIFSPIRLVKDITSVFLFGDDPVSPLYVICLPLVILSYKKMKPEMKLVMWYSVFTLFVWYFTPRTGGGRFILPYLPAFSLLVGETLARYNKKRIIYLSCISAIVVVSIITIGFRGIANKRYIPVIIGQQTKESFLRKHLNFSFGDYYDVNRKVSTRVHPTDKVLLYGFHNLYYIDFPYIDNSWIRKDEGFNYIATQHTEIPRRFKHFELIFEQKETGVKLYMSNEFEKF